MEYYDLWSLSTGNLVADAASQPEMLAFVRDMVRLHGPAAADDWSFSWGDDARDDARKTIAQGKDLLDLAFREPSAA